MANDAIEPSIVLAAYAEPWVAGRRVVVFGDALGSLAERLIERGARLVQVFDSDPTRVLEAVTRNASSSVSFAPFSEQGLSVRDGAFDFGIVENLLAFPDPAGALRKLKRVLSPRGAAAIAVPNSEVARRLTAAPQTQGELDYYGFFDSVAAEFEHVRMLGQTPFVGYAVVDFAAEDEPEPSIDPGFVPGGAEEPEWFIAFASQRAQELDAFSLIQLPSAAVLAGSALADAAQLEQVSAAERQASEQVGALRAKLARLEEELSRQAAASAKSASATAEIDRLKRALAERETWIAELEARAATADERADAVQAELDDQREQAERAAAADKQRQEAAKAERAAVRKELEEARQRTNTLEAELRQSRERLQRLEAEPADVGDDVRRLEEQLRERASEIRRLQSDLKEAERIGRELLAELSQASGAAPRGAGEGADLEELRLKLDKLAQLNAEREADLTAAQWTVQQLQARMEGTA